MVLARFIPEFRFQVEIWFLIFFGKERLRTVE